MNRRVFVKGGALSLLTIGLSPSFLRRAVFGMPLPAAPMATPMMRRQQGGRLNPGAAAAAQALSRPVSLAGLPQVVGLALGAPEFQRR